MSLNYFGLFEDWEIAVARNVINSFLGQLEKEGVEDLLQECLTHWFFHRNQYTGKNEASQKTFMAKVVKNKLIQIIRKNNANKRKSVTVSLNEPVGDENDSPTLMDVIPDEQDQKSDLKVDLIKALQKLTPQQKQLCQLIAEQGLSVKEAGIRLNRHRSTLYDDIRRIKEIFKEEGLLDYLD